MSNNILESQLIEEEFYGCVYCSKPLAEEWSMCCGEVYHGETFYGVKHIDAYVTRDELDEAIKDARRIEVEQELYKIYRKS